MKKFLFAASLIAASILSSHNSFAIQSCSTAVPNREFTCTEDPELGPQCSCPLSPTPKCTVTVTVYDDLSIEVTIGEKVITNPGPLEGSVDQMANQIVTELANGKSFSYQP